MSLPVPEALDAHDYDKVFGMAPNDRSRMFDRTLRERFPRLGSASAGQLVSRVPDSGAWAIGSTAIVYRMHAPDGNEYAIRCLKRAPEPRMRAAERCRALNAMLRRHRAGGGETGEKPLPYFVRQDFHEGAVVIRRIWRPVFVMDWVEGVELTTAVREYAARDDSDGLRRLAAIIVKMTDDLQRAGIAHGHYSGDNIVVTGDGAVRLVDYDSLALPDLQSAGDRCPVVGEPALNHPHYTAGRAERPLAVTNDTFATVALTLSLRMLAADAGRRAEVRQGAGIAALTAEDLADPHRSPAWQRLDRCEADEEVPRLARLLRGWCRETPEASERLLDEVPDLPTMLGMRERWPAHLPPPRRVFVRVEDLPPAPPLWPPRRRQSHRSA